MKEKYLERLKRHHRNNGVNGLLPQNIPLDLLREMAQEYVDIKEFREDSPTTLLLYGVVELTSQNSSSSLSEDELSRRILSYGTAAMVELQHREGMIRLLSFPTVENIFDPARKIKFTVPVSCR